MDRYATDDVLRATLQRVVVDAYVGDVPSSSCVPTDPQRLTLLLQYAPDGLIVDVTNITTAFRRTSPLTVSPATSVYPTRCWLSVPPRAAEDRPGATRFAERIPMTDAPVDRSRHIHFALLEMATVSHNNYGLWAHPANEKYRYREIGFWKEIAKLCEDAKMDALFLADVLGIASSFGDSMDTAIREAIHVPELDPALVAAAAMDATEHLGFGVTVSSTYEPPFGHARRMSTLDALSDGRVGWNVVMSYHPNANENFGLEVGELTSEQRYERAEDFMDACYELWEHSWEDDAVVADRANQVYADPAKVHRVDHVGPYFRTSGPHLMEPTTQRTPVIFQAGMSDRGREFAAKHAEVIFLVARTEDGLKRSVADIRAKAESFGRGRHDVHTLAQVNIIVAPTMAEAEAELADFQRLTKADGYLAHEWGGGFNPLAYPREMRLDDALREANHRINDSGAYGHGPDATIGDVIDRAADLSQEPLFVHGDPATVADTLERWVDDFDLDGFLMRNYVHPGTVKDFGDLLVPELQKRGRYRTEYEGSTLRENLFGAGHVRVPDNHPAASHRF
jgi:FMN-dependent oxidoreductase (nitrilotriacetate monooxygenase family)